MPRSHSGPSLPQALLDQVTPSQQNQNHRQRRANHPANRNNQRNSGRSDRNTIGSRRSGKPDPAVSHRSSKQSQKNGNGWGRKVKVGEWEDDELSEGDFDTDPSLDGLEESEKDTPPPPKKTKTDQPGTKEPKKKDKATEREDAEIAALEKKLGIAGRSKLPKSFEEDGLGDLLGELEGTGEKKRKRDEGKEWLEMKRRRRARASNHEEIESGDDAEISSSDGDAHDGLDDILDGDSGSDLDNVSDEEVDDGLDDILAGNSDSGADSEGEKDDEDPFDVSDTEEDRDQAQQPPAKRTRENPYVAPGAPIHKPEGKYIPPSLRGVSQSDAEANARLRRQTQGLLNKLSEANIISILGDIEILYISNPRQYVTSTLIDLLLGLVNDQTVLNDTFIILHAGFITAVYKIVGPDFGAQLLERLVHVFDEEYAKTQDDGDVTKSPVNLLSLLTQLYNLQMISCALVFDYIRMFLSTLSEANTELLLRVVRLSGSQLRSDDPSALKDIVLLLQKIVIRDGEAKFSVRTKFMIETINDLKNNKMKTGITASAITAEHAQRMKRTIGALNQRNIKATEPLRITLSDIRNTEKKGKWWLVGASWKGAGDVPKEDITTSTKISNNDRHEDGEELELEGEVTLEALAKSQGMNNPVRRAIFAAILSAVDPGDAYARILRLNLKRKQESEIPHVLLHCAGAEAVYNPYYTIIARRVCAELPKLKKKFEFALWDLFRKMGENKDEDEDSSDDEDAAKSKLSMPSLVSYAKLYADLTSHNVMTVLVFKVLDLTRLQPQTIMFVEVFLITLILLCTKKNGTAKGDEKKLLSLFGRALEKPQLATGLQYFLSKYISKSDLAGSKGEKKRIKAACEELVGLLQVDEGVEGDMPSDEE